MASDEWVKLKMDVFSMFSALQFTLPKVAVIPKNSNGRIGSKIIYNFNYIK